VGELSDRFRSLPDWLTVREAAAYLKVDRTTIYRYCEQGRLRFSELTSGGGRRFKRRDLDALLSYSRTDEERAELTAAAAQLEAIVFPKGREHGPLFSHARTDDQWLEMSELKGRIAHAIALDREYFGGVSALLWLAAGLLKERARLSRETSADLMTREQREFMLAAGLFWDGSLWVENLPQTTVRVPPPSNSRRQSRQP